MVVIGARARRKARDVLGDGFRQHASAWSVPPLQLVVLVAAEVVVARPRSEAAMGVGVGARWLLRGWRGLAGIDGAAVSVSQVSGVKVGPSVPVLVVDGGRCERGSLAGTDAGETRPGWPDAIAIRAGF